METYSTMRQFADSWGLLLLFIIFIGIVIFAYRPGSRATYDDVAKIPLQKTDPED
ncbi:cbb3-type cytochrome c oxidase subunit 3 [Aestuariivirga sp.]|jgi:cytochrome c oxidase cbb3-type subunit 4|uniref:cbb3-type cytochrome c oxidase subunit 3 n=1 Tax=Aestuariivirga sp. TaxID=2650926 RepID=UPI0037833696